MITDPDNPNQALDKDGNVNVAVWAKPLDRDGNDVGRDWLRIGWALPLCFTCGKQHPSDKPCPSRS